MTKVELSLFIEANYPISGMGSPRCAVHGVGINDSDYMSQPRVNGKQLRDPAYASWQNMLKRAYGKSTQKCRPTYIGVTVCEEWLLFSAFREWWLANYREGWQLDKDLLSVGNREYRPSACIYIPNRLNNFTADCGASRGELPIGVHIHKQTGKFESGCQNQITGKNVYLGLFDTKDAAHAAWLRYKLSLAIELKPLMDSIDKRIYNNVVTIINSAR